MVSARETVRMLKKKWEAKNKPELGANGGDAFTDLYNDIKTHKRLNPQVTDSKIIRTIEKVGSDIYCFLTMFIFLEDIFQY